jgi:mono/diheme cytochrome c family protein
MYSQIKESFLILIKKIPLKKQYALYYQNSNDFSSIFLVKCSSLTKAPREADFTVAQKKWTNIKMEDLSAGHAIYTKKCNTCHGLKEIKDYNQDTWTKLIDAMAPKAKLNKTETLQLRQYIYSSRENATQRVNVKF